MIESPALRAATASPARYGRVARPGGRQEIRISRREDLRQAALQALSDPAERDVWTAVLVNLHPIAAALRAQAA